MRVTRGVMGVFPSLGHERGAARLLLDQEVEPGPPEVERSTSGLDWSGGFWERRYSAEPVLDDATLVGRLRYVLAHGVKEGLVDRRAEWPGLTCLPQLLGLPSVRGEGRPRAASGRLGLLDRVSPCAVSYSHACPGPRVP